MKRTITIEFDRVKITTTHNHKNLLWCEICQAETEFLNRAEAADLARVLQKQGLTVKEENLHLYQPTEGQILVCLNSILNGNNTKIY